jgi:chromosomal replication initiation ATPase DnaA
MKTFKANEIGLPLPGQPNGLMEEIRNLVSSNYNTPVEILMSRARDEKTAWVRHVGMYLCYLQGYRDREVSTFWKRDRAIAVHARQRVEWAVQTYPRQREAIVSLISKLNQKTNQQPICL